MRRREQRNRIGLERCHAERIDAVLHRRSQSNGGAEEMPDKMHRPRNFPADGLDDLDLPVDVAVMLAAGFLGAAVAEDRRCMEAMIVPQGVV